MNLFNLPIVDILSFLLTFMRVSLVMFLMPVLSSERIPTTVKAAASLIFTLGVWPHLALSGIDLPAHPFGIFVLFLGEIILGLILGMCVNFVFMGIQAGGELLGFQMGFTMISFADPLTGNQTGITAFFLWMVSILTFLSLDGHLYMIRAFSMSFYLVPPGGLVLGEILLNQVIELSIQMFALAVSIAAPVMVTLFLVELTLALVSRTSPQINIMDIGFPTKISAGFFFLGSLLVMMSDFMANFIVGMDTMLVNVMRAATFGAP